MDARELRCGNLIYDLNFKEVVEVNTTILDQIDVEKIDEINHPKLSFKPIPITEEWLMRFGFETNRSKRVFKNGTFKLSIWYKSFGLWINQERIEIKTVHQLQNLYFVLTGKELELKEK